MPEQPITEQPITEQPITEQRIVITYCRQCNWMLRSTWYAQELLSTFAEHVSEVALKPSTGGVFTIRVNEHEIWDRVRNGGFPDIKLLKQSVRNVVAPDMPLGHSDSPAG